MINNTLRVYIVFMQTLLFDIYHTQTDDMQYQSTKVSQCHFIPMLIMIGSMTGDTRPYIYEGFQKPVSPSKYATLLLALKPTKSEEILKLYPPVTISDERDSLEIIATDFIFTCSMRNFSRNPGLKNGGNIWR